MTTGTTDYRALLQRALSTIEQLEAEERKRHEPIAIVGMACRFPGGIDRPEAFWKFLCDGTDAITEVPPERWSVDEYYDPNPDAVGKAYTRWGGFLKDLDGFDAEFFGNAPREAVSMDPQHRLLLEVAWESLERAGQGPARVIGSRTGVFIGVSAMDYAYLQMRHGELEDLDAYFGMGTSHSIAAGRLAYALDLRGPAVAIDTACSSSLVALHLACQSLRSGESDMALGGGVNVMLCPDGSVATSRARMMSFTGRCHTFDAAADGYVRSEGCALLVLKRLSDAVAGGDDVLAVIRGTALNQDGRSNGLTAPNPHAQERVIMAALADAGARPDDIGFVEAHGTGTTLGDPIEMRALGTVFGARPRERPLMVGAVKTNVGHLEAAAGVASLMKVVLSLQHKTIPPHLHLHNPNPYIAWDRLPITVPTRTTPWADPNGRGRLAGISSFGFSGTNAHMIVGEAPVAARGTAASERPWQVLPLSARSTTALAHVVERYEERLSEIGADEFADACFTAGAGRTHFAERLAVVAASLEDARQKLAAYRSGDVEAAFRGAHHAAEPAAPVFMFTGQGAQYAGMGRGLYETQPVFRTEFDRCAEILEPLLGRSLHEIVFDTGDAAARALDETVYTQPALFALEWALARTWMSWGVRPAAVLGHSVGEYVAACVAGVFSLEDGLRLLAARARLMNALPRGGAMASVMASAADVRDVIAPMSDLAIAALNGPTSTVISGALERVSVAVDEFTARGWPTKVLPVSHAFHSPLMEPMLAEFAEVARSVDFAEPEIDLLSNVTGEIADETIATPEYWVRHVREPVQFARSIETLHELGHRQGLEIGPSAVLVGMAAQCIRDGLELVPSLRAGNDDVREITTAAARLYAAGTDIDWEAFAAPSQHRRVVLPTYPFERTRYWLAHLTGTRRRSVPRSEHPLLGERLRSPRLQEIVFQAEVSAATPAWMRDHCVFGTIVVPAAAFLDALASAGRRVLGEAVTLQDSGIHEPLALDDEPRLLQTVLEAVGDSTYKASTYSSRIGEDDWKLHASALVRDAARPDEPAANDRLTDGTALDADLYYAAVETAGVTFGPRFRLLHNITVGSGWAAAVIDAAGAGDGDGHELHPTILDAAFQLAGAALSGPKPGENGAPIFLPVGAERVAVTGGAVAPLQAVARVRAGGDVDEVILADVEITSGDATIARVEALRFKRATVETLRRAVAGEGLDYRVDWEEIEDSPRASQGPRSWLVLADDNGVADALADQLRGRGDTVTLVRHGPGFEPAPDQLDLQTALAETGPISDVIHCWALDSALPERGSKSPEDACRVAASLTGLVRELDALGVTPRLNVITRGAQQPDPLTDVVAPAQAAIWGAARVVHNEHDALRCKLIDIAPAAFDDAARHTLVAEIEDDDRTEWQVALRDARRLAPRLMHGSAAPATAMQLPESTDAGLTISKRGVLDNLHFAPLQVDPPARNEVQIAVAASGLNFRDVLSALGMYPGEPGPLGGEVVGTVVAVGGDVHDLSVGDEVMALCPRGFCTRVNTPALLAWKRPLRMSPIDAATMPVVFQTAWYSLHEVARMQKGERVLIHAGAGGVGLAAIQLAQAAGAEIFATAGSEEKRALLRRIGVQHVMDSRSLDFAEEIRTATGGEGIDVVLNSLAGDFIPRSLELLREGGRFVELGKTDVWDEQRAAQVNPRASYHVVYLGELCVTRPELIRRMFRELDALVESGVIHPLPVRVFPLERTADAFRYMAQARHIGKVVIDQRAAGTRPVVRSDGAYLVTGGLGGVGHHAAAWLANRGAGRVVVAGRTAPAGAASVAFESLRSGGSDIVFVRADVSDATDVRRAIEAAEAGGLSLRGIVHAAGVLDDGAVLHQTEERFARVFAPKVTGGWHLIEAASSRELDFVVLCSAGAGLFGAPGQANYAAANTFLDGLAAHARERGVPACSIAWGAWRDTGMMAGVSSRDQQRWAQDGFNQLEPAAAVATMERVLRTGAANAAVLNIDWRIVGRGAAAGAPLFRRLVRRSATPATSGTTEKITATGTIREQLTALPADERQPALAQHVTEQVRRVLDLPKGTSLRSDRGFSELGMDSLMAVELSNRLRDSLGCSLPTTLTFEHPTLGALVAHLMVVLELAELPDNTAGSRARARTQSDVPDTDVDSLSAEETSAALLEELNRIGY